MKINQFKNLKKDLELFKKELAKELKLKAVPLNSEIIDLIDDESLKHKIQIKPTRTISGVSVVAIMSKPEKCPHGKCSYCPGDISYAPQSYTGHEPATMRALQNEFDPYKQVTARIEQLTKIGHLTDKIELIVMGGTFISYEKEYVTNFCKRAFDAMNSFSGIKDARNLEEAQKLNETATKRCVALCIESRPDYAKEKHVDLMLKLGATRVEIGVQTLDDKIYRKVDRGHTVKDVIESTQILKDSGLKTLYHIMPGLYKTPQEDLDMYKQLFLDPNFRPDGIKIYPCLVLKGTKVYDDWKSGKFTPINTEEAIELIIKLKQMLPKYVRTMRINRDIPTTLVEAGIDRSNIGQMVYKELEKRNIKCNCIRCREAGHLAFKKNIFPKKINLVAETYESSRGTEEFISFEDTIQNILVAFARLRIPSENAHRPEIESKTAIIRQLHVFSPSIKFDSKKEYSWQHRGFGKKLIMQCEKIAKEKYDIKKLVVTSGVGAREYYKKQGYLFDGTYMIKDLQ